MPVVFFQNGWDAEYQEAGGPGSPNFHKSNALKTMRAPAGAAWLPARQGRLDYALVDALQPLPGDIVIPKPRYSAFYNTNLDSTLRARASAHWSSPGSPPTSASNHAPATASSSSILASSCTTRRHAAGPPFIQEATVYNVQTFFGWVSSVAEFNSALQANAGPVTQVEGQTLTPGRPRLGRKPVAACPGSGSCRCWAFADVPSASTGWTAPAAASWWRCRYRWHGALGRFQPSDRDKVAEAVTLTGIAPFAGRR